MPVSLRRFIGAMERFFGKMVIENLLPMQAGDVSINYADIDPVFTLCGFQPNNFIEEGISKFVEWYKTAAFKFQ